MLVDDIKSAEPAPRYSQNRYGVESFVEGWKHSRIRVWSFREEALRSRDWRIWRIREWKLCDVGVSESRARVEKEESIVMKIYQCQKASEKGKEKTNFVGQCGNSSAMERHIVDLLGSRIHENQRHNVAK